LNIIFFILFILAQIKDGRVRVAIAGSKKLLHKLLMKKLAISLLFTTLSLAVHATPFCVSHRGLGFGGLENSLEAFEAASKGNAKAIEFDIHHTRDGQTIIYHDNKLDRLVTGLNCLSKRFSKLNFEEIRANCRLENGEVIPSFEEALRIFSQFDSTLFIEFKDKKVTDSDINLIKKYYSKRPEKIVFISFKNEPLLKIEELRQTDEIFKKMRTARLKVFNMFGKLEDFGGISALGIGKDRVERMKKEGKLVGVYTKDSRENIEKYLEKGVDFITTNDSPLCEEIIRSTHL
jgi:glycerophosphoryl diester phosphodiesterase